MGFGAEGFELEVECWSVCGTRLQQKSGDTTCSQSHGIAGTALNRRDHQRMNAQGSFLLK